jgi:isopentenyl-diphosphate delta-isomerase
MAEQVILVDEHDNAIGLMEKMEAHRLAKLHRAFSVFAMNDKNEILLQRRALHKYHSGGLWTNTCCSHPRDGENVEEAAKRRLMEEMGFTCDVKRIFSFIYKAELDNDLTEHELDHVLIARWNDDPNVNPDEVDSFDWQSVEWVATDMKNNPDRYTVWFKIIYDRFLNYWNNEDHGL